MVFSPKEIILSPTSKCNLNCPHCTVKRHGTPLEIKKALSFLSNCRKAGIRKLAVSGGEPFLKPNFLYEITKQSIKNEINLYRIMTNGVWFKNKKELESILKRLSASGFYGELCVSVDSLHKQDLKKLVLFIRTAHRIFKRNDIVSIAYVSGSSKKITHKKLESLSLLLDAQLKNSVYIKNEDLFIKLNNIGLSPVGKARKLQNPWDGKWFKEDYCKGPGNTLFVSANGDVSPCCGYANEEKYLLIGNIYTDTLKKITNKYRDNPFVRAVFNEGLSSIRKSLVKAGARFPGKTSNHCYFCWYIQNSLPLLTLNKALKQL
jgi:MoaA/NifB/PqqE/SkfB family radical SAM enzyme